MLKRRAVVEDFKGNVEVRHWGEKKWILPEKDMILNEKDEIRTGLKAYIILRMKNINRKEIATVRVKENTKLSLDTLTIDDITGDHETLLDLAIGTVLIKSKKLTGKSKFEIYTPTSMIAVRGTVFEVNVKKNDILV